MCPAHPSLFLFTLIFFCSSPWSIIPTFFPSSPIFPPSSQRVSCLLQAVSPICHKLNDLHSFSPPAAQETARQMMNAVRTLPGLETRYAISLDCVGRHTKSHQLRLTLQHVNQGLNGVSEKVDVAWEILQQEILLFPRSHPTTAEKSHSAPETDKAQLHPTAVPLCCRISWSAAFLV